MAKKSAPSAVTSAAGSPEPATTQRAYTLRLRGVDGDTAWRDALWATHEAINKGAKAFGDWLLTLRGGLSHELAEPPPPAKGKKRTDEETAALRKSRRILLALSWLSVEDERGAPPGPARIATGRDTDATRRDNVLAALRTNLSGRRIGKQEIESWLNDCADSLAAKIREDAVWVNRSACFDQRAGQFKGLSHAYASESILSFFGPAEDYFTLPDSDADDAVPGGGGSDGPEFRTLARQWASTNFGTGEKSDTDTIVTGLRKLAESDLSRFAGSGKPEMIAHMAKKLGGPTPDIDGVRIAIGWKTGRPSKGRMAIDTLPNRLTKTAIETMQTKFGEEADSKEGGAGLREVPKWMPDFRTEIEKACGVPFVGERNHIGEFSVMLDHAARRVSIGHSWIKRAESERLRFEEDAKKLDEVPADIAARLDRLVVERSGSSGATAAGGEYRIRRRAIEGWDEVLKRWKKAACKTASDRVAAAREVQADPEIDKFGDIQLFEALAADDAECVWRINGKADASPLRDYVLGHDARNKQQRFKVPAYRHPDPLRHPVFGDFGNSRWEVQYAALEAAKATRGERRVGPKDAVWIKDPRSMRMALWDGDSLKDIDLRWSSKRLAADLALGHHAGERHDAPIRDVTRADRLGLAASGMKSGEVPSAAGLFALGDWNARLQAPRRQLDDLAKHVERHGWDAKAKVKRDRIRWLASFSAKLECRGPFIEYAKSFAETDAAKPFVSRKGELAVKHATQDKRQGNAKLILSRLPGLRTLSVDLGHRFAAGCAVWEALTLADFKKEIAGRAVVGGGTGKHHLFVHTRHTDPKTGKDRTTVYRRVGPDKLPNGSEHPAPWARLDRQFLIKLQGEEKPARAATTGTLKDGSPTAINEVGLVADLAKGLGLLRGDADERSGRGVDELMRRAVGVATLGLKRHGRRAKIAYALNPTCTGIPGMGGSLKIITRGDEEHVRFLTGALVDWHALATDTDWDGTHARELWNTHLKPLSCGFPIEPPGPPDPSTEAQTRQQRRKASDAFRDEKIKPIAIHLATLPSSATKPMHDAWARQWKSADGVERTKEDFAHTPVKDSNGKVVGSTTTPKKGKESSEVKDWHARLRLLTDWLMGRHLPGQESKRWNRNVGGLSLTRIATMRSLYQLHKAFAMRPTPDKVQGAPKFGESNTGIAQGILDTMERMREQRVKQLASRIAEAALGIGRVKSQQLAAGAARPSFQQDKPCHAVVIESLRNYRPDELQTRRENKALMEWSSGKVRKYLEEACQLHGLHLREIQPNYTSRQCSRTGLPGIRCADVAVDAKTGEVKAYWWKKSLATARKKIAEGKQESESRFLVALADHLAELKAKGKRLPQTVRVPRKGGDLFMAATPDEAHGSANRTTSKALQADLNAAANIGLRALLDPDFPGRWWYVPASIDKGRRVPAPKSCTGAACLAGWGVAPDGKYYSSQGQALTAANEDDVTKAETTLAEAKKAWNAAKKAMKKSKTGGDESAHPLKHALDAAKAALAEAKKSATQKEIINLWQDPQADRPANAPSAGRWRESGNYWAWVRQRAVHALCVANGLNSELVSDAEE